MCDYNPCIMCNIKPAMNKHDYKAADKEIHTSWQGGMHKNVSTTRMSVQHSLHFNWVVKLHINRIKA